MPRQILTTSTLQLQDMCCTLFLVSAKSAHVGTSVRVHPCHRTPQALDEVLARFHLQGRRKQQTVLKEVPDALDGVEIWCELWMLTDGGRACRTYVRTRRATAM